MKRTEIQRKMHDKIRFRYLQRVQRSGQPVAIKFKGKFHHQEFTLTSQKTCTRSCCIHDPRRLSYEGDEKQDEHRKRSAGQVAFHLVCASVKARYCNFVYLLELFSSAVARSSSGKTYVLQRFDVFFFLSSRLADTHFQFLSSIRVHSDKLDF